MRLSLSVLLLCAAPLAAGERGRPAWKAWLYRSSRAALVVAHSIDIGSSWQKRELNPLLRGPNQTFGPRGAALKVSMFAGVLAVEQLVVRRRPSAEPYVGALNFAFAGLVARQATRNLDVPRAGAR